MPQKPISEKERIKLEKFLARDEQIIFVTGIGRRYFWIKFLLFLPLAFFLIGIPKLAAVIRMRQSFHYILTNRRFLIIRGIFSRKITTAPLERITHITVEQSFNQRYLYGTGNLVIITAGFDQREIVIENIGDPVRFKILIDELTQKREKEATTATDEGLKLRNLRL